jgi:hypothetical protein
MKTVEDAYQVIARALIDSADSGWDKLLFDTRILSTNCSAMCLSGFLVDVESSLNFGFEKVFLVNDAAIFIRDNLLRSTGERIWGLTFTLYLDGKFNIEYDYNKPEDYEETDEAISLSEALGSLQGLPEIKGRNKS